MGALIYLWKCGAGEWAYSFDLSGGIYRTHNIAILMEDIKRRNNETDRCGYSHPNTFEINGKTSLAAVK